MKEQTPSTTPGLQRDNRLDLIKAICIVLVLFWHFQPIDITAPKLTEFYIDSLLKEGIKSFYMQVSLLAVPTFILVALYLFYGKLAEQGSKYLWTRLWHLIQIYFFWVGCQFLIFYLIVIPKSIPLMDQFGQLKNEFSFHTIFIDGGPRLPEVGSSVFYYLSILIVLTVLAVLYWVLAKNKIAGGIAGICIVIGSLVYFEHNSFTGSSVSILDLRTYILYIPIAYYFQSAKSRFSKSLLISLAAGYILLSIQDYFLRRQGLFVNVYMRASIAFGAAALFYGIKNLKQGNGNGIINFLSSNSLGIYATHKYFQYISVIFLTPYFVAEGMKKKVHFGDLRVNLQTLLIASLAAALTLLCVFILSKTPLRRFIR